MTYVFMWFVLSWLNKKQWCIYIQGCFITVDILFCLGWTRTHYSVMYSGLFYHCWHFVCLGWTRNIILWCIQGCFITVDNVKPVNGPRMHSFNTAAPLGVGNAFLVVIISISVIFLDRSLFEGMRCCFSSFGPGPSCQTNFVSG